MLQEIIRGEFGQYYTFLSPNAANAELNLEIKTFWDIEYTRQFVNSLHTTPDYFAELLSQLGQRSGHTEEERVNAVSHALLNRQLRVYPVKPLQVGEADLAARTLEQDNNIYQIRHASVVLLDKPQLKRFSSHSETLAFIQQFDLDKKVMSKLILEADWQSNPATLDESKQTEKLAELILANKLVITQRTVPEPAKPEGAAAVSTSTVGNRRAGLGPDAGEGEGGSSKSGTDKKKKSGPAIHTQEKANSCVVASSRNIIENETGVDVPESKLRKDMKKIMGKPDHDFEKNGTNPVYAQKLLKKHGVDSDMKRGLSLDELEQTTKKKPVLIGFKNPGHRVILDSVKKDSSGKRSFIVHDPAPSFKGKPRTMTEAAFKNKYNDKAVVIIPK